MMKGLLALMVLVVCKYSSSSSSSPDDYWTEKSKMIDKQGSTHYYFGSYGIGSREIAFNNDYIIIGSAGDQGTNGSLRYQGSASVFGRQGAFDQTFKRKFRPPSKYQNMSHLYYGQVVDANKNFLVVGAHNVLRSVYIYRAQYPFELVATMRRNDLDAFGESLSIDKSVSSDNTLVIGAPRSNGQTRGSVCIYQYKNEKGKDVWTFNQTLKPSDLQDKANFGERIASTRNHIIVVAPGDYSAQDSTVYAYRKNADGSWNTNPQRINNPGIETNSLFGSAIALGERCTRGQGGDIQCSHDLVIGAKRLNKVFVYELSGSNYWVLRHTLTSKHIPEKEYGITSNFGSSVAIHRNTIAVGAPGVQIGSVAGGACFLFHYDKATGNWSEGAAFRASDMQHSDFLENHLLWMTEHCLWVARIWQGVICLVLCMCSMLTLHLLVLSTFRIG